MVVSVTLTRFIPENIGARINSYLRNTRSNLSQVFQRHFKSTPKPIHQKPLAYTHHFSTRPISAIRPSLLPHRTFTTGIKQITTQPVIENPLIKAAMQPKRSFSTYESNKKMWMERIKKAPHHLILDHVNDLTSEKINDLISLFEKEGLIVDEIDLSVSGFTKELLQKLFSAIGKWQTTLPGFVVINTGVFNIDKYFFKPSLSDLKECEFLLRAIPTKFGFYEMQQIPLNDAYFIDKLSEHILNVNDLHSVFVVLKDPAGTLRKPPINPLTGEPDLSPIIRTRDCPTLSNSIDD